MFDQSLMRRIDLEEIVRLVPPDYNSSNFDKYRTKNPVKKWVIERYIEYLVDLIEKKNPLRILSVGCGEGVILYYIQKFNKDIKIVGIDLDNNALNVARTLVRGEFRVGDARKFPSEISPYYDVSLCASVFEHIRDGHELIIDEMRRFSKQTIITIPHPLLFRLSRLISFKNLSTLGRERDHIREFYKGEIQDMLPDGSTVKRWSFWYVAEF